MGKCLSHCTGTDCSTTNGHMRNPNLGKPTTSRLSQDLAAASDSDAQILQFQIEPLTMTDSPPMEPNITCEILHSVHPCTVYANGDRAASVTHNRLPSTLKNQKSESSELVAKSADDVLESKLDALFDQYRDLTEDSILADGIENLCADLGVRPDEFCVLVLAWKFQAETMCRFTRAEFVGGCNALGVSDIAGIQGRFLEMVKEVEDKESFKDMYRWAFRFALDSECGQRTLPLDMALGMWCLVFSENKPPLLAHWLEFLEGHRCVRGITKDTWDMFLNFLESVNEDFSSYDDTEAWPSLFDDFVEWAKEQKNSRATEQ